MLTGSERPDSGVIRLGPAVKAAYLPQVIHFEHPERSILDTMLYELDITPQSARNRLAAYQFTGEDVFKSVSVLSGGELSRLRLCMLMDESINLLILDEPTNHLDIDSREWLEQAVEAFDGTLLFVSHDRYFINRFATRVWELAGGVITDYPMGFAQYRQAKEEERAAAAAAVQVQSAAPKKNGSRGNRAQQAAKKQLTICETAIARLEADSARLEAEMAENACDAEKLNALYQEQQDTLSKGGECFIGGCYCQSHRAHCAEGGKADVQRRERRSVFVSNGQCQQNRPKCNEHCKAKNNDTSRCQGLIPFHLFPFNLPIPTTGT